MALTARAAAAVTAAAAAPPASAAAGVPQDAAEFWLAAAALSAPSAVLVRPAPMELTGRTDEHRCLGDLDRAEQGCGTAVFVISTRRRNAPSPAAQTSGRPGLNRRQQRIRLP
jgi:hypothetical protein